MFYRDWSIVRVTGGVATVTVDASDASTWFSSFRDVSSRCSDPSRGVEIDGVGRVDTGELLAFTIVGCDNAPGGSGPDAIRMLVASVGYDDGGALSSGDLVRSGGAHPAPAATRARGVGAIGPGTPTLGSNRQEFDFDVNATPGGRLSFSDYSVVRNGAAGRMIVDATADASTGFTSFHQTSATCVRYSGRGRVDTGELLQFYVDACDNASSGTGFDTFAFTIPDRHGRGLPYLRSGPLSGGDIVVGSGSSPAPGSLDVTTTTTGSNLDPDGYTVTVDGANGRAIPINGATTYTNLAAGSHTVALAGVAANCTVSGGVSRTVSVPSGGSAVASFAVNCASAASALVFTVQPSNAGRGSTIQPAVQVSAVDAQGNRVASFSGLVTIAIGRNGGLLVAGRLSGTTTVSAVNGVATFADLSIDQIGNGYTLGVTATGLSSAESQPFNIGL